MANDGTHRGGGRVRAGAKPDALNEKLNQGRPAIRLTTTASDLSLIHISEPTRLL